MMRARSPGIPTIFITGYSDMPEIRDLSEPLFKKPVDMDALLEAIKVQLTA
jgi:FixJ family two-component response regulator